jgi:cell division protein FtsQ
MTQSISEKSRPLVWEDEAPAEPRLRRVRPIAPATGRVLPGMPLEIDSPDDSPNDGGPRFGSNRFDRSHREGLRNSWWRPATKSGRVLLTISVLVLLGGFATSAYLLKSYLDRDERFRINGASNIEATGLTEVSRTEMLPVFGEDIGRNVFFVPLSERRRQLEQIPWVERATVMRILPDQIRVSVVERQPVAFVRHGQQIGLIDANGVLLSMPAAMMAQHHYSFPVVTGIDAKESLASRQARMAVYQRLLAELDSNGQQISQQISEIDLTDPEDARVLMPEQGGDILAHFGQDQFLQRYQRYKAHINEWHQQYPKLCAVDLRYDQQVVLQMTPGSDAAQAPVPDALQAATGAQSIAAAGAVQDKPLASTPAVTAPAKSNTKPLQMAASKTGKKTATKQKPALKSAKLKAQEKKRAAAKRAALNVNRQKKPPTATRSAASAGEGL